MISVELDLAKNSNTSGDKLKELTNNTKDREILSAIAINPNTPPETLIELAGEYLEEIGQAAIKNKDIAVKVLK